LLGGCCCCCLVEEVVACFVVATALNGPNNELLKAHTWFVETSSSITMISRLGAKHRHRSGDWCSIVVVWDEIFFGSSVF